MQILFTWVLSSFSYQRDQSYTFCWSKWCISVLPPSFDKFSILCHYLVCHLMMIMLICFFPLFPFLVFLFALIIVSMLWYNIMTKDSLGRKGLFIILPYQNSSFKEVRQETQRELKCGGRSWCCLLVLMAGLFDFLYTPWPPAHGWYHLQWFGAFHSNHQCTPG